MKTIIYIIILGLTLVSCRGSKSLSEVKKVRQTQLDEPTLLKMKDMYIDAQTQKNIGNFKQAMRLLDRVLEIDPYNHAALFDQAMILDRQGEYGTALKKVEKASQLDPSNTWYQILRAQLYTMANQLETAEKIYADLVERDEDNFEYNYDLASLRMRMGDYEGAIAALDAIEKHAGLNEEVIIEKQSLYLEMRKPELARKEIEKLIEINPKEPRFYHMLATTYELENNEEKVMESIAKIEELDPNNAEVKLYLYDYYIQKGTLEKADDLLLGIFENPQIDIDVKMEILLRNYEQIQSGTPELKKAFDLIDILKRVHPEEAKSFAISGDFYMLEDNLKQARDDFKRASELDPSKMVVWSQLVMLDAQLDNAALLVQDANLAMEYYPTAPLFYFYAGVGNNQLKNHDKAIEKLLAGKELVYDNPDLKAEFFSALGDSYYEVGKFTDSDKYFDKSLKINPDNAFVLNNYSYYLSVRKTQLDKAEQMSKQANELQPNSPSFQDTYGWVLYQNGKYDDAKIWLQKAIDNGGGASGVILEHFGDVLFKLGAVEEALDYWEKAEKTGDFSEFLEQKIQSKNLIE